MKVPMTIAILSALMATSVYADSFGGTHNLNLSEFNKNLIHSYQEGEQEVLPELTNLAFPQSPSGDNKPVQVKQSKSTSPASAEDIMRNVPHSAYQEVMPVSKLSPTAEQALETSIMTKLGRQFKGEALVPYHTLIYWQGPHLYVHFTDIAQIQSLDRFLKDHPQPEARTHVVIGHSKYSQHDYDKLLYKFDTFYSKKSAGGTILKATPIVGRLALAVEVERAYPYMTDSVKNAFGNRISVTVKGQSSY